MGKLDCKNYKRDSLECDLFEHYKRRGWNARLTLSRVIAEEKSKES